MKTKVEIIDATNEFSFILKPSPHGVGVFAVHDIKVQTYLRLFGDDKEPKHQIRILDKKDVPEILNGYCIDRGTSLVCPKDFGCMPVGWYLNHSKTPNAAHQDYHYYAVRDIAAGEEITIDYNSLEEPKGSRPVYYRS